MKEQLTHTFLCFFSVLPLFFWKTGTQWQRAIIRGTSLHAVSLPGGGCSDLGKGRQFHPPSGGRPHPDVDLEEHHVVRHGLSRGQPVVVDPGGAGGVGLAGLQVHPLENHHLKRFVQPVTVFSQGVVHPNVPGAAGTDKPHRNGHQLASIDGISDTRLLMST